VLSGLKTLLETGAHVPSREWLKFGWRSLRVAEPK
jgi:hypothetical protein